MIFFNKYFFGTKNDSKYSGKDYSFVDGIFLRSFKIF
jgi:hypothetical protein